MKDVEAKNIASALSAVLGIVFDGANTPEEVANTAKLAARDIIKSCPKVAEWVDHYLSCNAQSPNFNKQFDRRMKVLKFLKD